GRFAGPRLMRGWLLLALLLAAFARPAAALDRAAVEKLAYGDSEERLAAIAAIVAEGDPRALAIFQALADGDLRVTPEQAARGGLIVKGAEANDAATGDKVAPVPEGLDEVRLNNRLRGAVQGALAALKLGSSDQAVRLAAVKELAGGADDAM